MHLTASAIAFERTQNPVHVEIKVWWGPSWSSLDNAWNIDWHPLWIPKSPNSGFVKGMQWRRWSSMAAVLYLTVPLATLVVGDSMAQWVSTDSKASTAGNLLKTWSLRRPRPSPKVRTSNAVMFLSMMSVYVMREVFDFSTFALLSVNISWAQQ
jgi:hypothetical protein